MLNFSKLKDMEILYVILGAAAILAIGLLLIKIITALSKKALMRSLGAHNPNERAAKLEALLTDAINAIGLGPQGMGGSSSVLGVHVENTARHPSTIGVAVNVGCWSHRRGQIVFDQELNVSVATHKGVYL